MNARANNYKTLAILFIIHVFTDISSKLGLSHPYAEKVSCQN
jgi:hypothetical protein